MRAALYHPEYGYYTRLGGFADQGDFVTSPTTHPAFGALLGRQATDLWRALGQPTPFRILEVGGGNGALARPLIQALPDPCAVEYSIDEASPALRHHLGDLAASLNGPPHFILANEVLDAQPVHRLVVRQGQLRELRVDLVDDRLTWTEMHDVPHAVHAYFERLGLRPREGAIAEVNVDLPALVQQIADRLDRGMLLILDYGHPAEALFSKQHGTLLTYYRHTLGSDPLVRLGEQDISTQVDFTTLTRSLLAAGLDVLGVTSQARLLRNLGIEAFFRPGADRGALARLIDPNGLGRIGALFASRGLETYVPIGLSGNPHDPGRTI
jgi:SAM-dependent MidA family methyltransferase